MRGSGSSEENLQSVESKVKALTMSLVRATSMVVSILLKSLSSSKAWKRHSASIFSESLHLQGLKGLLTSD